MELWETPYPASRQPVLAPHGMVATSQPLAAQAGLSMLQAGGNAVDAAIATAIALTVLEPTSNGIGGDAFVLLRTPTTMQGYNGSGRSPKALTPELVRDRTGGTTIPNGGWLPVTVPGAPDLWHHLHGIHGRLPFEQLFQPAIAYARDGFPVSPLTARGWQRTAEIYAARKDPLLANWEATFLDGGIPPAAGTMWNCPAQARTLEMLASSGCRSLYAGDLARSLVAYARETGGLLTIDDLAAHNTDAQSVIAFETQDAWQLNELQPNTQGIVALIGLAILDLGRHLDLESDSPEAWHVQIEALKAAFRITRPTIADPRYDWSMADLMQDVYEYTMSATASDPGPILVRPGGTVYLCAADDSGMEVSFIQSNYMGFGSGLVVPGTGIALQNRGACFDPDHTHLNGVGPGKRPYHTIIPAYLLNRNHHATEPSPLAGPFGIMGGHMQPQAHIQFLWRIRHGWHVQAALDAPRWRWDEGKTVAVETTTPAHIVDFLRDRGHDVRIKPFGVGFGRGQAIFRLPGGGYIGGSDARGDGCAVGY